ncbi:toll/interleukin-1 receptor domain-containing protein [uncultured Sphingomonas sp.]|uniref:toll/interleukin-1 receptor domain-containing protein n=1 Tax=uncultured Sphingomonas sp. TaxID=158754 RepID=UPI0035C96524
MALPTRPFLVVTIAWHPGFAAGPTIASALYDHFRRKLFENVAGGTGLSVIYRSEPPKGTAAPLPIDFEEGETAAVVVLFDEAFAGDNAYLAWLKETAERADAKGLGTRVSPIAIDSALTRSGMAEQAIRWDRWGDLEEKPRIRRLVSGLTYQFARMLRSYLERLRHPSDADEALERYLKKVQVFLSHSKRDDDGERIAKTIRQALFDGDGLSSFFDVHDIVPGVRFDKAILNQVRVSAVVAIHTDSFSSREWCRREIIEAKRASVPLVVANCLVDTDERGFPYMGNVPVVRMDPAHVDRIEDVIGRLLDEVLKDFLWRCRVELVSNEAGQEVRFLPRPPELISLVGLERAADGETILVYPDPPLGAEEQRLFEEIAPTLRLRSLTEWVAEAEAVAT